ncbi:hypothetical protein D1AOALGA4SA_11355 [Olavius algarvensis Delta 1 endosymbiont]|nr:hypothetical protein D1AOALGA4SA_11355 [Olavius algarvensis Delta 1 endosymbiont]
MILLFDWGIALFKFQTTKNKSQINPKLQNSNSKQTSDEYGPIQIGLALVKVKICQNLDRMLVGVLDIL